jgi:nucleoside-diphosphate-sugar epimerase
VGDGERIFIVGCGDIGQRVAALESKEGRRVQGMARSDDVARRLASLGIEPIRADLDHAVSLRDVPTQGATLYYFAPPPAAGAGDPRLDIFLQAITPRLPIRIVYISTSGVYGDCGGAWIDELHPLNPITDRAKRRMAAESLLENWSDTTGVNVVVLRVPGIYGPGRLPFERIRAGRPVVTEAESPYSNRIHANDLARVCQIAGRHGDATGVYNVSDGHPTTMTDYFNRVADAVGLPRPPQVSMAEARRMLDPATLSFLEESKRLVIKRMRESLGVDLLYPTLAEGLLAC